VLAVCDDVSDETGVSMNVGRIFLQVTCRRLEGLSYQGHTIVLGGALCGIWCNTMERGLGFKRRYEVMNLWDYLWA
jgi:formylmethanofuran dehydrogenase subunit C